MWKEKNVALEGGIRGGKDSCSLPSKKWKREETESDMQKTNRRRSFAIRTILRETEFFYPITGKKRGKTVCIKHKDGWTQSQEKK